MQEIGESIFVDTMRDLIGVRLVPDKVFLGDPGRGGAQTTLDASGTPVRQVNHERDRGARAGTSEIRPAGRDQFRLDIKASPDKHQRRFDAALTEQRRHENHARAVAAHDQILAEQRPDLCQGLLAVGTHAEHRYDGRVIRIVAGFGPLAVDDAGGVLETRLGYLVANDDIS